MGGVHHARWHDAPAQIVIGALMGAVTAQRPTFPRPTRPSGTGGRGGCAEACPTGEVCSQAVFEFFSMYLTEVYFAVLPVPVGRSRVPSSTGTRHYSPGQL